eukprot:CAMPEP_0115687722 /NCGR_PEP_ID=MMETSP0272-20121206/60631_1 /TAXON_ID=71861 /ORGANISM="Scrippsiella trochoidea, Strain CCMP3099" /LENGTH=166 /DNA_ID=CAMNT_0003127367 /DNA_START=79 /DNA_END=579 /DNA_ORIENTATION=+
MMLHGPAVHILGLRPLIRDPALLRRARRRLREEVVAARHEAGVAGDVRAGVVEVLRPCAAGLHRDVEGAPARALPDGVHVRLLEGLTEDRLDVLARDVAPVAWDRPHRPLAHHARVAGRAVVARLAAGVPRLRIHLVDLRGVVASIACRSDPGGVAERGPHGAIHD